MQLCFSQNIVCFIKLIYVGTHSKIHTYCYKITNIKLTYELHFCDIEQVDGNVFCCNFISCKRIICFLIIYFKAFDRVFGLFCQKPLNNIFDNLKFYDGFVTLHRAVLIRWFVDVDVFLDSYHVKNCITGEVYLEDPLTYRVLSKLFQEYK